MKHLALLTLLLLASPVFAEPRHYPVAIDRVVDGDTVQLDIDLGLGVWMHDKRLRLSAVNSPEADLPAGKEATAFAQKWIQENEPLEFMPFRSGWDKYGRLCGDLRNKRGETLNRALLDSGHAKPY